MAARLYVVGSPPCKESRGPQPDIWLTVSAWIWTAYLGAVASAAIWLIF